MNQLLEELKKNGLDYCTKDRLISVGSTRAVFGIGDYVVKQHLFPYAFEQSKRECEFYELAKNAPYFSEGMNWRNI